MRQIVAWTAAALAMVAVAQGPAQVLQTKTYSTTGRPAQAVATPDGQYVLVTVDRGRGSSGIDVFQVTGEKLKRVAFQPLGSENAQGILLIPHTRLLAVGLSNAGVAFLPLDDALRGKAKVGVLPQGDRSGSGYLAATPDGKFLFVANEYGAGGNVGVISLQRDKAGAMSPKTVAYIPAGRATPGVAMSPDGARVYAVGEVTRAEFADTLPGHDVPQLRHDGCVQGGGHSMPNGALYAMDTAKMEALPPDAAPAEIRAARVGWSNAGCSPVRVAASQDGRLLYVTARGDNRVLVFDAAKIANTGEAALVAAIPSGGDAPVGLALFDGDKMLLVANSNRFAGGSGSAAVIDVSDLKMAEVKQRISTEEFPRNITASPDGKILYMTIFLSNELMVLRAK